MATYNGPQVSQELEDLLQEIGETKSIKKETYLFAEGEIADNLYLLESGQIRIGKLTPDGKEVSLRICGVGDLVGEISLYAEDLRYILNAKVLEDGEITIIEKSTLEIRLQQKNHLTIELIQIMNKLIRRDQMRMYDLISGGKKGALYSTLIRLSNSYGRKQRDDIYIDMALTNQELANFCGTARESVNRLLNELRQKEVLSVKNGYITIHDLEYMRTEINCDDCPITLCTIH